MSISNNLQIIRDKITFCEKKFGRAPSSVNLLAASKAQFLPKLLEAIEAGQRVFGENYLQEALLKIEALISYDLEWHFIGHIQSNKTRKIAENFSWVHSVSSTQVAKRLHDQRPASLPPLNVCLEINVDKKEGKSGISIKDTETLALYCQSLSRIKLRGLMAIPEPRSNFDDQRASFHQIKNLFDALNKKDFQLDTLSMGMTEDMEAAIAEGSTLVRVGTGIFGERTL